jgi:hypothetical protein
MSNPKRHFSHIPVGGNFEIKMIVLFYFISQKKPREKTPFTEKYFSDHGKS